MSGKIGLEHLRILEYVYKYGDVSKAELMRFPFCYPRTTAMGYLQRLVKGGYLDRIGVGHKIIYLITEAGYQLTKQIW